MGSVGSGASIPMLPTMIGLVPRVRPKLTIKRYSEHRLRLIETLDRQQLIEAIARHLYERHRNGAALLSQMYA